MAEEKVQCFQIMVFKRFWCLIDSTLTSEYLQGNNYENDANQNRMRHMNNNAQQSTLLT